MTPKLGLTRRTIFAADDDSNNKLFDILRGDPNNGYVQTYNPKAIAFIQPTIAKDAGKSSVWDRRQWQYSTIRGEALSRADGQQLFRHSPKSLPAATQDSDPESGWGNRLVIREGLDGATTAYRSGGDKKTGTI